MCVFVHTLFDYIDLSCIRVRLIPMSDLNTIKSFSIGKALFVIM